MFPVSLQHNFRFVNDDLSAQIKQLSIQSVSIQIKMLIFPILCFADGT